MANQTEQQFGEAFSSLARDYPDLAWEILRRSQPTATPQGRVILREGDDCPSLGFVLSGEKRVFKMSQTGREITLYEVGPGEICILNASCILADAPCPATAVALSDLEEVTLSAADFRELMAGHQAMRAVVFAFLNANFADMMELITEVAFKRMDARLMDYLIEKSENGLLETTHQIIANELGTAREVVSRLLKDLERKGRVRLSRGSIELCDL